MIELRFLQKKEGQKILQWRCVPLRMSDDSGVWVIEPEKAPSLNMERNWTQWEDVPVMQEGKG